jgi:hypothetical protein
MRHSECEHRADDGLEQLGARLRAERPQLTGLELDAVAQQARRQATRSADRAGGFMRSRIAILTMLVAGLLFSGAGAGLAVTGMAANDQASVAQYGGGNDQGGGDNDNGDTVGGNDVAGAENTSPSSGTSVQPARQTQFSSGQGSGQLPFTGFAAIPVLLLGVALLGAGLVLRRRGAA